MTICITMHIREIRKEKGITLVDLAALSGVSKTHISEIEREKQRPSIQVMCLLAVAMDVKVEELFTYTVIK